MASTTPAAVAGPAPTVKPEPRLWFVDNLRILLISLVVLHHIAVMYSDVPLWYYTQRPSNAASGAVLDVLLVFNQAWFMGAFFLLSGYFTPRSYDRKGPRAFLRDRLVRLGIPLLGFYFVLSPVLSLGSYHGGSVLGFYENSVGSGPLWFVLALLVFDACYAGFRYATRNRPARPRGAPAAPAYKAVFGFVLALAVVTYVLRIGLPNGFWVPVVDFPTISYLPQYVSFFVLGMVAYRRGWFQAITSRMGRTGLGTAVGATVVFLPLAIVGGPSAFVGHGTVSSLFYALWDSTFAVGICLAMLTFFRRRFDTQGRVRRYLSNHVFTVYVTHAIVVTVAGVALSGVPLPTLVKFVVAAVVGLPACFALAGPVRRLPGLRRVL